MWSISWCAQSQVMLTLPYFLLLQLFSIAILAAGIWFFIERNYMSSVMQSDLFSAGSILLFIVGVVIFIISFFGCFGAYRGIRWMLFTVSNSVHDYIVLTDLLVYVYQSFQGGYPCTLMTRLIQMYLESSHPNRICWKLTPKVNVEQGLHIS